jgi:hypothetical protein
MKTLLLFGLSLITLRLQASDLLDQRCPIRGLCIGAPSASQMDRFIRFINEDLAPRSANTLILRVDYNFQYASHPELGGPNALSREHLKRIADACQQHGIKLIPQINLLGHQSWANHPGALLRAYPEFDETPWVKMPEKYSWPNPDKLYCKSYCPLHPKVHGVVFALVDELCEACGTDTFHAGMDEVFYIGEDKCTRCSGQDKAQLFADEVTRIHDHLAEKGRKLWIWGDRLLDGSMTGLGEWEASRNGTHRAVDLIPKDILICDWHYERPDPTAVYFAFKGLQVVTCPWRNPASATHQVQDTTRVRQESTREIRDRVMGIVQTVWSGANTFLDDYYGLKSGGPHREEEKTEAKCFVRTFDEIAALPK